MGSGDVYRCSDGRYFGDVEIWERFESGAWTPFCWEETTGREWVETRNGELLFLVPVSERALPDSTQLARDNGGLRVHSAEP